MSEQPPFETKEDIYRAVMAFYRDHCNTLSGPSPAVHAIWNSLRKRIRKPLLEELAKMAVAHEVSRFATLNSSLGRGWTAGQGFVAIRPVTTDAGQPSPTLQVPVHRLAWDGPTIIYPRILTHTIYTTATVAKALIDFTNDDFKYCIAHFVDQRNGIDRHIGGMTYGMKLLTTHHVSTVKELPQEPMEAFAQKWQEVVRSGKEEEDAAD